MNNIQFLHTKIIAMMQKQAVDCPKCQKRQLVYNRSDFVQCVRCNFEMRVWKRVDQRCDFSNILFETNEVMLNRIYREMEKFRLMKDWEQEVYIDKYCIFN